MSLRHFTFMDLFKRNAQICPRAVACVSERETMTYAQLFQESCALQAGLLRSGFQAGERIAVLARNSYHFFPLFAAVGALGGILVLINRRLSQNEIQEILTDTSPRMLITDEDVSQSSLDLMKDCLNIRSHIVIGEGGHQSYQDLLKTGPADPSSQGGDAFQTCRDDPFAIIHTAAVFGKPRGAVLSQENLFLSSLQLAFALNLTPADCYLNMLPLFHIMGINLALAVMLAGGNNVIMPQFDAPQAAEWISRHRVSLLGTFPPMLGKLLEALPSSREYVHSLRHVLGLEQAATIEQCQQATGATFWSMYGQTETSGLVTFSPFNQRPGSAGRPGALVGVKIVDEFDRDLPPGSTGEILIQGPLVFQGYWQQPELNALTFREDWHHTGDLGVVDEDGFVFFKGRKAEKDLIKSGGENVFPVEVEKIILEHPAVLETSVIGIPDPTYGEGIKAVCVLHPEQVLSEQELILFVGAKIAGYKKPRCVEFIDALPKTEQGTIDRVSVKERYG